MQTVAQHDEEIGTRMDVVRDHGQPVGRAGGTSDGPAAGPTVLRIGLGSTLRRLREQADISRETAGDAIRASVAKISRMELGRVGFKIRDVADLLSLYNVTDPTERDEFLRLARQ